jgi:hypothetical protein
LTGLYDWPTSSGKKITIMRRKCGLLLSVIPLDINKRVPEHEAINPDSQRPASIACDAQAGDEAPNSRNTP